MDERERVRKARRKVQGKEARAKRLRIATIIVAIIAIILSLLAIVVTVQAAPITPNEPIPPADEVPYGDWQVKQVLTGYSPTRAKLCYPNNARCTYEILTECLEPAQPNPVAGEWYRREGSRKWFAIDSNHQDLKWLQTITKPVATPTPTAPPRPTATPTPINPYMPLIMSWARGCSCYCYTVQGWKWSPDYPGDGWKMVFEERMTPDKVNDFDYFISLNATKNEKFKARAYWCGHPSGDLQYDSNFRWGNTTMTCQGQDSVAFPFNNKGWTREITCVDMNGTNDCVFEYKVQTCELCLAENEGNDPLWQKILDWFMGVD